MPYDKENGKINNEEDIESSTSPSDENLTVDDDEEEKPKILPIEELQKEFFANFQNNQDFEKFF